ncbi:hypothetical protein GCM10025771_30920 [Niveibacterium umoris]|uniref:AraC-like DNA-binding protein n=1 Tax=Niveibacterium umoris TaxID=1193620 RepID=A0A840BLE7_9RHOO|nr:helix-turn-helix domain-containing protein [Niveibacterium umoris]MBB4011716.1 AraC-like DNA-binding protein [Niveibacterium umoris]
MSDELEHDYVPEMRHYQPFFLRYRDQPVRLSILQSHFGLVRVSPSDARPLSAETALQMSEWLHANGDPHAFAWLASELDMGAGDGLVYYLRAHDSLEAALEEFTRLTALLLPDGRIAWSSDGHRLHITLAPVRQATRLGVRLRYESILVWFVRVLNYVTSSELPISQIQVMSHEGANPAVLATYLGVRPSLGGEEFVLEYPAEVLKIHLPGASAALRNTIRPLYDQRLTLTKKDHGNTTRVASRVANWMSKLDDLSDANLDAAASALAVGASTLRRQLAEQGCRFSALLAAMRAHQAMNAILGSDEKMESLAQRLGYADRNTFERAFRERFDVTPALCRRAARELLSARRFATWSAPQNWSRHSPSLARLRSALADGSGDANTWLESLERDPVLLLRILAHCAEPAQGASETCIVDTELLASLSPRTLLTLVEACVPMASGTRAMPTQEGEDIWRCGELASRAARLIAGQLAPADAPVIALAAFAHNLGALVIPAQADAVVEGIDCTWLLLAAWHVPAQLLRFLRARHAPMDAAGEALALAIAWAEAATTGKAAKRRAEVEARIAARLNWDLADALTDLLHADSGAALSEQE